MTERMTIAKLNDKIEEMEAKVRDLDTELTKAKQAAADANNAVVEFLGIHIRSAVSSASRFHDYEYWGYINFYDRLTDDAGS